MLIGTCRSWWPAEDKGFGRLRKTSACAGHTRVAFVIDREGCCLALPKRWRRSGPAQSETIEWAWLGMRFWRWIPLSRSAQHADALYSMGAACRRPVPTSVGIRPSAAAVELRRLCVMRSRPGFHAVGDQRAALWSSAAIVVARFLRPTAPVFSLQAGFRVVLLWVARAAPPNEAPEPSDPV